jgi:PAS domain S-box-containing protein
MDTSFRRDADWLGTLFEMIPDFVVVVDSGGIIRYINKVEEEYQMDEVIGQPLREFLDPRVQNSFDEALQAVFEREDDSGEDALIRTTGKTEGWYRSRMFPLRRDGKAVAAMMLASNLAELTAAEQELDRIRRLLPVCAWCNRVRGEDGEWESVGAYLQREMEADISHGLCPVCDGKLGEGPHTPGS